MRAATDTGEGVLELVDQLEDVVGSSRRLPLSTSVVINEDELLELVDRIRLALPDELVGARHTLEDAQRIMEAAETDAERLLRHGEEESQRLVREAREQVSAMVSQHSIVGQAQAHADTLLADAEERAAAVRHDADSYAREVMSHIEEQMTRALATVRRGLETLPAAPSNRRRRSERR